MRFVLPLTLLVGCEMGPNPDTVIDELRVVAAIAEPAAVFPGESYELSGLIADPEDNGFTALAWTCGPDGCVVLPSVIEQDTVRVEVPGLVPAPVWLMVCEPGLCEHADPDPADLANPLGWMQRLPFEGVSLASRTTVLATDEEDCVNPTIELQPETIQRKEDGFTLSFRVPGAIEAWGYSTAGGFQRPTEPVSAAGNVKLTWFPPKNDEVAADLWVVFEDGEHGAAVWQGASTGQ